MREITQWLEDLGLAEYAGVFAENKVDLRVLPELDNDDLREMNIPLGPRKLIVKAIAELRPEDKVSQDTNEAAADVAEQVTPIQSTGDAERRHLTVMFVDLVGSTALSGRLDPEEMREAITLYQNAVAGAVTRFDGHVAKFMGDGVLCYFGWPVAHEDDAERSIRAGLAIVHDISGIKAPNGEALSARVGVGTGLVVVGDLVGEGAAQEEAVVGETPNLAARLQGVAAPGQVALAESTRRLLGDLFDLENLGEQDLRGIAEPVPAYIVQGERVVEARFDARRTGYIAKMVGRDQELELLLDRWRQAKSGEGQMVLLTGEAGIGKSRIARGLIDTLGTEDHTRVRYQCSPYHTDSALYPAIQQMTLAAGFDADDPLETRLDKLERLLFRARVDIVAATPLLAGLLGLGEIAEARHGAVNLSPQQRRVRTLEALTDQLTGLASEQPVLFVLEDAHWIDPTTLELVELCLDRIGQLPVMLLITARPTFEYGFGGHPIVTRLALNRLGRDQVGAIVNRITNGKSLPVELLSEIAAKTDGVPLFVEEFTKTILESEVLKETETAWVLEGPLKSISIPASLHDSLMARLDRLQPVKEVAQSAACIGREFDHRILAEVSPLSDQNLQDALEQLIGAELLFRRGSPPEATYMFKHALVRDAAYESLLKRNRKDVHARIARAIEEKFPERVQSEPALLAHHCTEADLKEQAIEYWQQAGQQAIERSANIEAISHLTNAVGIIQSLPASIKNQKWELRLQTMLAGPMIATKGYGGVETGNVFTRAQELSEQVNDPAFLFPVLYQQWVYNVIGSRIDEAHRRAVQFIQLAEQQSASGPKLIGHRVLAVSHFYTGDFALARGAFETALGYYQADEHKDLMYQFGQDPRSACLAFLSSTLLMLGHRDEASRTSRDAIEQARRANHANTLGYTIYFGLLRTAICNRDLAAAEKWADELLKLAKEQGLAMWTAYAKTQFGWILSQKKLHHEAIETAGEGLNGLKATGTRLDQPFAMAQLAEAYSSGGQHAEAIDVLNRALEVVNLTNERWCEAELLRLKGDALLAANGSAGAVEAEDCYQRSMVVAGDQDAKFWTLRSATSLAFLLLDQGERKRAHGILAPAFNSIKDDKNSLDLSAARELLDEIS